MVKKSKKSELEKELETKRFELSVLREIEDRPPVLVEGKEVEFDGNIYRVGSVDGEWEHVIAVHFDYVRKAEEK